MKPFDSIILQEQIEEAIQSDPLVRSSVVKFIERESQSSTRNAVINAWMDFCTQIELFRQAAWSHLISSNEGQDDAVCAAVLILAKVKQGSSADDEPRPTGKIPADAELALPDEKPF